MAKGEQKKKHNVDKVVDSVDKLASDIETETLHNKRVEVSRENNTIRETDIIKYTRHIKEKAVTKLQIVLINREHFKLYNTDTSTAELTRFMNEYIEGKPVVELDGDYMNMNTVAVIHPTYKEVARQEHAYYVVSKGHRADQVYYDKANNVFRYARSERNV